MTDKIINFQQRRQLDQAVADFAQAANEHELATAARQIVLNHPADDVLAILLKHLDTADSQVRGGLGHLAALLPQEAVLEALRSIAANRQQSPLARMTATSLAQHFLGVELPPALTQDIRATDDMAFQSLREAIETSKHNRHILLEYVSQMRELGEEIAFLVINALERIIPPDRVELLRLLAQDGRPAVARAALTQLEALSNGEASVLAVRALHTLQPTLPPELSAQCERALRKMRMAGRRYTPPAADGWRALIGPAEPNGSQTVWLLAMPDTAGRQTGALLGFLLNGNVGILRFFASETIDRAMLPTLQPIGSLVTVQNDVGGRSVLLEVPFDYGRWLVAESIAAHWRANEAKPTILPGEYQLYNDLIWQFAAPVIDAPVQQLWQAEPLTDPEALEQATALIFTHPALEGWSVQARAVMQAMPATARPASTLPPAETINVLLRAIAQWPEGKELGSALAQGLREQAGWFYYAGAVQMAQAAAALATASLTLPITENPVLAQMLAVSLRGTPKQ